MPRSTLLAFAAGLVLAGSAAADVPDPNLSIVRNVVVSPDASMRYRVFVTASTGPVDSALVEILFSTETDGLLCWCVGQTHPALATYANAFGEADFYIAAGGCVDSGLVASPPAVEVYANGVKLAEVGVVSPDAVDNAGIRPPDGWNPGASCNVALADAVYHTGSIATAAYDFCTDINSDETVNIADAVLLTSPIISASVCTRAP